MDEIRNNTPRGLLKWIKFGTIHGVDIVSLLTPGGVSFILPSHLLLEVRKKKKNRPGLFFDIFVGN